MAAAAAAGATVKRSWADLLNLAAFSFFFFFLFGQQFRTAAKRRWWRGRDEIPMTTVHASIVVARLA